MRKCSLAAYAVCSDRHLCGTLEEAVFNEGSECATFNDKIEQIAPISAERLRELIQADHEGRLLILPCKEGDTVHFSAWYGPYFHAQRWDDTWTESFLRAYGKCAFASLQAAEKAWEEMKHGGEF